MLDGNWFYGLSRTNFLFSIVAQLFCVPGTGLTMHAAVVWSFAFSASLDGMRPTMHEFDGVIGCCDNAIQPIYNFSIYDIQFLPVGSHSLRLSLLNSTSGSR